MSSAKKNLFSTDYEISLIICNFINFVFYCTLYENRNRQKKESLLINKSFNCETIDILIEIILAVVHIFTTLIFITGILCRVLSGDYLI